MIGLDQTSWPRLEADATKPWQMWALTAPGVVVHRIRDDKSAATFTSLVGDYHGVIVADALGTHEAGARASPGIVLAGCWAHVYRRFEEALPDHPDAERALAWIGALYELDESAASATDANGELRRAKAPAILDELKRWLWIAGRATPRCRSARQRRTRSASGIGSRASSTTRASRSTTTRPSAPSEVRSSVARITTARSRDAAPRSRRALYTILETLQAPRHRSGRVPPRCSARRRSRRGAAALELRCVVTTGRGEALRCFCLRTKVQRWNRRHIQTSARCAIRARRRRLSSERTAALIVSSTSWICSPRNQRFRGRGRSRER